MKRLAKPNHELHEAHEHGRFVPFVQFVVPSEALDG